MALDLPVEIQHQLLQPPVVPAEAEGVRQLRRAGAHTGVKGLQHAAQHTAAQQGGLPLVQHTEVRRQPPLPLEVQQVDVLPQQGGAEGVDGLDVRLVDQQQLALEVAVTGPVRHAPGQLLGDALAQLRRCRAGVGDDEEVVHIGLLLPQHAAEQAVHQHAGLAAAGGGGDQQAPPLVLYHSPLAVGQHHAHIRSSSMVVSIWLQNSAGVTGRISSMRSPPSPSMKWQAEANSQ